MGYKTLVRIDDVILEIERQAKTLQRVLDEADRSYDALLAAQNGATNLAWGRILFSLADTGNVTLTAVASDKTIEGSPGHSVFTAFKPGRNIQITNFTNAGNNQTVEVSSVVSPDKLYLAGWTAPVDETDTNARAQENPTQPELDIVQDVVDARVAMNELSLARFQDVTSSNRAGDLDSFVI